MKKICIGNNPADAHLLKGLLEGENIEAEVRGEFLYGVRGEVPVTQDTCLSVWVMDDTDWDQGIRDLHRTTEEDGTFIYTFFKGMALK